MRPRSIALLSFTLLACVDETMMMTTGGGSAGTGGGASAGGTSSTGGGSSAGGMASGGGTATAGGSSAGGSASTNTSGFMTNPHGMSFENYTNDNVTNLTPVEVRRMFGDRVCASMMGGMCTLTPAAAAWMEQANGIMAGGHCFGFSHFALTLFKGSLNATDFGGANGFALMKSNVLVQREIAYWMATQLTTPANTNITSNRPTPQQLLRELATLWGSGNVATLAFFNRMGQGGHAVTPHSIRSRMDGKQELVVYDNNFPNMDRVIVFDPTNDSWSYNAAINPTAPESAYDGDATTKSIFMVPLRDAQMPQQCSFCGDFSQGTAMTSERTVGTTGTGDLMIEDGMGHQVGTVGKAITNTFPGSKVYAPLSAELFRDNGEPQYVLPGGSELRVQLDGANLAATDRNDVSVVGPGYALSVEGISLDVGQRDTLVVSADGDTVTYQASGMESAQVFNSFSTAGADFEVGAQVSSDANGASFTISRTATSATVRFAGAGATQYGLVISKIDQNGVTSFAHMGEALTGDATLSFDFGAWPGQGMPLAVDIDEGSDGSVDRTVMLTDQN